MREIKRKAWQIGSFQRSDTWDGKNSGVDLFKSDVMPFINLVEVISINEHMEYQSGRLHVVVYYRERV